MCNKWGGKEFEPWLFQNILNYIMLIVADSLNVAEQSFSQVSCLYDANPVFSEAAPPEVVPLNYFLVPVNLKFDIFLIYLLCFTLSPWAS